MKYLSRTKLSTIQNQYDYIIGWGTGSLLQMNYESSFYKMDFLVDGANSNIGKVYEMVNVISPDQLKELSGNILIVIYAIYEEEILEQLQAIKVEADTIIYNLLEVNHPSGMPFPLWNSKNAEDMILLELIKRLGLKELNYMDIGVCHPVMRNNTYLLAQLGYQGVLIEPNPKFHDLINQYRPKDRLLKIGAGAQDSKLEFYMFPDKLGYSTFIKEIADARKNIGYSYDIYPIPVVNINSILDENFSTCPAVISIDTEGLDYEILKKLDTEHFPVKIILCETLGEKTAFDELMALKGYRLYLTNIENSIYVRNDCNISGLHTL